LTEVEIFIEAYLRGVEYTSSTGEIIHLPKAWMRRTAFNIIREYSRNQRRYRQVAFDETIENRIASPPDHREALLEVGSPDEEIQAVLDSMAALDPEDCRLIYLRTIEGLSWQQVREELRKLGHPPISRAALRKRGQRALERLRAEYHRRRPPNHDAD
jgi:DNA-directed RNA polymerase specialized sigma24 family protein